MISSRKPRERKIGHSDGSSVYCVVELVLKKLACPFVDDEHAFPFILGLLFSSVSSRSLISILYLRAK